MKITGPELLAIAREGRPNVEYRLDVKGEAIGALVDGEWHRVAVKTICGPNDWVSLPYELLVNGQKPPFVPDLTL